MSELHLIRYVKVMHKKYNFRLTILYCCQVKNSNRPWVGKEEKVFTGYLRRAGAKIVRNIYFEEEPASIENHFKVIETLLSDPL